MDTEALISEISREARPVKPLARPELRALGWFVLALATAVVVMAIHGINPNAFFAALSDPRMLAEVAATALSAVTAALDPFRPTLPGAGRRWFWQPFAAAAAWVLLTGSGCAADYASLGPAAVDLRPDTDGFVPGALIGPGCT